MKKQQNALNLLTSIQERQKFKDENIHHVNQKITALTLSCTNNVLTSYIQDG